MAVQFHITVLGDCGLTHPSFEDWQKCSVCEAIMKSRVNTGYALVREELNRVLYPCAGARDAAVDVLTK